MGFKFLTKNIPEQPNYITQERFNELVGHQLTMNTYNPLSVDNRPAVFLNVRSRRDQISDQMWEHVIEEQRKRLIEDMWEQGMISHTIISQDENGFTLRTEIIF